MDRLHRLVLLDLEDQLVLCLQCHPLDPVALEDLAVLCHLGHLEDLAVQLVPRVRSVLQIRRHRLQ